MNHNIIAWQNIAPNLYDAGGKIVLIQPPFLTTVFAMGTGGIMMVLMTILGTKFYFEQENFGTETLIVIGIYAIIFSVGAWMLRSGYAGKQEREAQGGIHPEDVLYFLDKNHDEVKKQVGFSEELVTKFSETSFQIKEERNNKTTHYKLQLLWPTNKKVELFSSHKRAETERIMSEIKTRLGISADLI